MKQFACIVFMSVAVVGTLFSQKRINIPLDDNYEAEVYVKYLGASAGKPPQGYISVKNSNTGKEQVRVDVETFSDDEYLSTVDDTLSVDEQAWVLYDDYNFDGIDDVALINGQLNYDDSYQYQVYLGSAGGNFTFNPDFTEVIAAGGELTLDKKKKELHIKYENDENDDVTIDRYKVKDNKPILIDEK